jgi:hypothetical protein
MAAISNSPRHQPPSQALMYLDIWQGPHRLYTPSGPGPLGGAKALGFSDADSGGFEDVAPYDMARPSAIRTVIAADFDNDGYEELFFNNIGDSNRLFRQVPLSHVIKEC